MFVRPDLAVRLMCIDEAEGHPACQEWLRTLLPAQ
jgi:hypothetical protein